MSYLTELPSWVTEAGLTPKREGGIYYVLLSLKCACGKHLQIWMALGTIEYMYPVHTSYSTLVCLTVAGQDSYGYHVWLNHVDPASCFNLNLPKKILTLADYNAVKDELELMMEATWGGFNGRRTYR